MKKQRIIPMLILFVLLFTGCAKAIPAEEAAPLLIDRMMYQKDQEKFEKEFKDGAQLSQAFLKQQELIKENFTKGLLGANQTINQTQADDVYQLLINRLKDTSYSVSKLTESKGIYSVVYSIKGFAIEQLLQTATAELVKKIHEKPELINDQTQLITSLVEILKQEIPKVGIKEVPTDVSLQLKKERGKWALVGGQEDEIGAIYLSFTAGVHSQEQFKEEVAKAVLQVVGTSGS